MPQMAAGCLSENWLLKELGSLHWDRLCDSLNCKSHDLADAKGRRLYATFVRVRLILDGTLAAFQEGDDLRMIIQMERFGKSTLLSTIDIASATSSGTAMMMSTFSFRTEANNTSLAKSEPAGDYSESIAQLVETPRFFTEYSEVRKRFGKERNDGLSAEAYQINPFTDSNGANLLYFASYQSIHDFLSSRGAPDFHTKLRDIYYFRNCELVDRVTLTRASEISANSDSIRREDMLFRASDSESIAYVSTLKERV